MLRLFNERTFFPTFSTLIYEANKNSAQVHPIAAVEVELSLWDTSILTNGIAKTCADLNIPIVAYSPLGWGILAGAFSNKSELPEGDFRRHLTKFQDDNMQHNIKLVDAVKKLAASKGVAPAQIALAWILTLSEREDMPTIIPIPGGTTVDKVTQNLEGVPRLTQEEMGEINTILKENQIVGGR